MDATEEELQKYLENFPEIPSIASQQNDAEISKWELETKSMLDEMEHIFRGERFDAEEGKWSAVLDGKGKNLDRIVSEQGIKAITTFLKPLINKNTILSNYDIERVKEVLLFLSNSFTNLICVNYKRFEIEIENVDMIIEMIENILESAYRRAMAEGERNYRKTWQRIIQTFKNEPNQENQSIWNKIGLGK